MNRNFVSQSDWVDAIMELVKNLNKEGKQDLYKRMEEEQYYAQPTRTELEEKIEDLESRILEKNY